MTTPGPQSPLRWPFKGRLQSGQEDNLASSLVSNWVTGIVCVGSLLALWYIKTQRQAETCVIRLHHSRVSQMWQSKDEKSKTLIGRGRRKYVFWQKRFLRSLVYLYSDYCKRKCGPAYSGMLFINVWHWESESDAAVLQGLSPARFSPCFSHKCACHKTTHRRGHSSEARPRTGWAVTVGYNVSLHCSEVIQAPCFINWWLNNSDSWPTNRRGQGHVWLEYWQLTLSENNIALKWMRLSTF